MEFAYYVLLFALGMALGSFINVLSLRYNPERNVFNRECIRGRSKCDACGRVLKWHELMPILSFCIQGGRCKTCRASLTLQYPIIEAVSGLVVAGIPWFLNYTWGFSQKTFLLLEAPWWHYILILLWIAVFLVFLLITLIDLKHFLIPDELTTILGVLGIFITAILSLYRSSLPIFSASFLKNYGAIGSLDSVVINHVIGSVVVGALFWMLHVVTKGRGMGFGDVKLAFVLGLIFGWPDSLIGTLLSFVIGGVWGTYLLLSKRKKMKDRVPFGPIMIAGYATLFFFGFTIVKAYFNLLGLR